VSHSFYGILYGNNAGLLQSISAVGSEFGGLSWSRNLSNVFSLLQIYLIRYLYHAVQVALVFPERCLLRGNRFYPEVLWPSEFFLVCSSGISGTNRYHASNLRGEAGTPHFLRLIRFRFVVSYTHHCQQCPHWSSPLDFVYLLSCKHVDMGYRCWTTSVLIVQGPNFYLFFIRTLKDSWRRDLDQVENFWLCIQRLTRTDNPPC
jgi:hypothetical protein